jgi:sugar phosphate isomerase/epimerase
MTLFDPPATGLESADSGDGAQARDPLAGRLGLTVPHEWWASAHLLKSFEAGGFAYAQLDAPPPSVLTDTRLATRHALATADALSTTGLRPILHAPPGLRLGLRPADRAMEGLIGYAAEIGASQIVYHALALPDEPTSQDLLAFEARSLRHLARLAEDVNVRIAIENLCPLYPGPETVSAAPLSLRALANRIGSDAVGLCLDLGHAHVVAELRHTSLERLIEPVLDLVTLFHVHDNFGARRGDRGASALGVDPLRLDLHLPPGRGSLPWQDGGPLVSAHAAPVICEVHPPFRPRAAELREDVALLLGSA